MSKQDTSKKLAAYQPGLLNIARKNGWPGHGSPMLYVPFGMLEMYAKWPETTPQGASYVFIESALGRMGLSLTKLARLQPSRTLFDLAASDSHYAEVLTTSPPGTPPEPGQGPPQPGQQPKPGQPPQPGQPGQQPKSQPTPAQQEEGEQGDGEGEDEGEGQAPPTPKPAPQPKVRVEKVDIKQKREELAQQETEQRQVAEKISHARFKAQEKQAQEGEGSHAGGVLDAMQEVPKDLVRTMMAIMQRMVGGFDLNLTPMWDSSELVKRIVTKRTLDPARRHEEGRPAMTLAVDVSGSCQEISASTGAVAAAASMSGEYGVDMLVWRHSNGEITTDEYEVEPGYNHAQRRNTQSTWHLRNGRRMAIWPTLTEERRNAAYASGNQPNAMRQAAYAVLKKGTPPALKGNNVRSNYAISADILLIGDPAWVVVYTDTDGLALIQELVERVRGETKIAWVDYRTIPNRWSDSHQTYLTVRKDGLADNRHSKYGINRPTFQGYWSSLGEHDWDASKIPSKPMAAYSPRFVGDDAWIPWWFCHENNYSSHAWTGDIGRHRNGRRLYVIPNCDTLWGVIESMKLIAAPERMKQARDFGVATLSMFAAHGHQVRSGSKWGNGVLGREYKTAPTVAP